jgi:hypothetical protein
VPADVSRFLENRYRERLAAGGFLELRQSQRGRHSGRTAAHDQNVDFQCFARHYSQHNEPTASREGHEAPKAAKTTLGFVFANSTSRE